MHEVWIVWMWGGARPGSRGSMHEVWIVWMWGGGMGLYLVNGQVG
jgi:hypothetical protein